MMREALVAISNNQSSFIGAEDGTRTRYLQLGKLSLYQVSYFR